MKVSRSRFRRKRLEAYTTLNEVEQFLYWKVLWRSNKVIFYVGSHCSFITEDVKIEDKSHNLSFGYDKTLHPIFTPGVLFNINFLQTQGGIQFPFSGKWFAEIDPQSRGRIQWPRK